MTDKLCVSERRTRILNILTVRKRATCEELSTEFDVSLSTIIRDINYISSFAPVYTKQGKHGGIYILPEYRSYKNYLSDSEELCLYNLMEKATKEERRTLCGIITKFTKNSL